MLYYIYNAIIYYVWGNQIIPVSEDIQDINKIADVLRTNQQTITNHETFIDEIKTRHTKDNYGLRKTDIILVK